MGVCIYMIYWPRACTGIWWLYRGFVIFLRTKLYKYSKSESLTISRSWLIRCGLWLLYTTVLYLGVSVSAPNVYLLSFFSVRFLPGPRWTTLKSLFLYQRVCIYFNDRRLVNEALLLPPVVFSQPTGAGPLYIAGFASLLRLGLIESHRNHCSYINVFVF